MLLNEDAQAALFAVALFADRDESDAEPRGAWILVKSEFARVKRVVSNSLQLPPAISRSAGFWGRSRSEEGCSARARARASMRERIMKKV